MLIPWWRDSSGARAEREAFDDWKRGDQIFYLDGHAIERVTENDDYERLRAWIQAFRA